MRKLFLILTTILITVAWAGPSLWTLNQTPTTEVFNGITAPNNNFAIGVAENGVIVHFQDGDNGTIVPSGTTKQLLDVYAVSENFAIASGEDVVTLWDGQSWTPLFENDTGTFYTGTWASPEEDVAFFQSLGQFNVVCPHIPGAQQQPFCRAYSQPMLTACGESGDIKMITADGDVHHINNFLVEQSGIDPLHDEPVPLFLTGVWVPPHACLPGAIKPLFMYAIRNTSEIWRFDGDQWADMNVQIPGGQTLSWIGGITDGRVIAVGFQSDGQGGNEGVVWVYNGQSWTQDTNLPAGTPGLTDIAMNVQPGDLIFANGFDTTSNRNTGTKRRVDILAAAERGQFLFSGDIFPNLTTDIRISKRLLTPEPIRVGDRVVFQLVVQNLGPEDATDFRFIDGYRDELQYVTENCGMEEFNFQAGWRYRDVRIPLLEAGDTLFCTMEFDVVMEGEVRNYAAIAEAIELNYSNNRSDVRDVMILPAQ